jgi:ribosome-associated protein
MNTKEKNDHITLGQALKKYDLVTSGGMAKVLIASGEVFVNGEVETRRGRKLYGGEAISVNGQEVKVELDYDGYTT